MAISNDVLSSTLRILLDEEVDNLFKAVPLLDEMRKAGGVETYDGGQKLDVPLILSEHSSITQLSNGYEPVNLAVKDALRNATFNWCDFVAPVVITAKEELSNKGPRAIVSIAEARMKSVMGLLQREVEKQLVAGSSSVLSDLNTLRASTTARANGGFLAGAAYGTQTGTVGGIDTQVFSTFQNQYKRSGTLSIEDMTDLYIQCQAYTPGGGAPNVIISSAENYREYKKELFDKERFMSSESQLDGGRLALAFHGARMYYDPFLDNITDGTNDIRAYFLNTDYLKLAFDSDAQFEMSDFEHISGYASRSANIITRMQMYVQHLGAQGLLTK
tara:strand:+ start:1850 stop:2842 length:993 start_codon:yes stop_codon:yes gene_type:complete